MRAQSPDLAWVCGPGDTVHVSGCASELRDEEAKCMSHMISFLTFMIHTSKIFDKVIDIEIHMLLEMDVLQVKQGLLSNSFDFLLLLWGLLLGGEVDAVELSLELLDEGGVLEGV